MSCPSINNTFHLSSKPVFEHEREMCVSTFTMSNSNLKISDMNTLNKPEYKPNVIIDYDITLGGGCDDIVRIQKNIMSNQFVYKINKSGSYQIKWDLDYILTNNTLNNIFTYIYVNDSVIYNIYSCPAQRFNEIPNMYSFNAILALKEGDYFQIIFNTSTLDFVFNPTTLMNGFEFDNIARYRNLQVYRLSYLS